MVIDKHFFSIFFNIFAAENKKKQVAYIKNNNNCYHYMCRTIKQLGIS